mmetsp:Transcript_3342/g.4375  ORF Transcript_3342/g.4375 Transcript_3342/m.4375 type:complete len:514 (+) Transcript_3342:207-1748(+)
MANDPATIQTGVSSPTNFQQNLIPAPLGSFQHMDKRLVIETKWPIFCKYPDGHANGCLEEATKTCVQWWNYHGKAKKMKENDPTNNWIYINVLGWNCSHQGCPGVAKYGFHAQQPKCCENHRVAEMEETQAFIPVKITLVNAGDKAEADSKYAFKRHRNTNYVRVNQCNQEGGADHYQFRFKVEVDEERAANLPQILPCFSRPFEVWSRDDSCFAPKKVKELLAKLSRQQHLPLVSSRNGLPLPMGPQSTPLQAQVPRYGPLPMFGGGNSTAPRTATGTMEFTERPGLQGRECFGVQQDNTLRSSANLQAAPDLQRRQNFTHVPQVPSLKQNMGSGTTALKRKIQDMEGIVESLRMKEQKNNVKHQELSQHNMYLEKQLKLDAARIQRLEQEKIDDQMKHNTEETPSLSEDLEFDDEGWWDALSEDLKFHDEGWLEDTGDDEVEPKHGADKESGDVLPISFQSTENKNVSIDEEVIKDGKPIKENEISDELFFEEELQDMDELVFAPLFNDVL